MGTETELLSVAEGGMGPAQYAGGSTRGRREYTFEVEVVNFVRSRRRNGARSKCRVQVAAPGVVVLRLRAPRRVCGQGLDEFEMRAAAGSVAANGTAPMALNGGFSSRPLQPARR